MLERVGVFVLLCKWHSFIQLSPFIYFTFIINTSHIPMLLKVSRKHSWEVEGYYLLLGGRNEWSANLSRY